MKEALQKLKPGDTVFVEPGHRTGMRPGWFPVIMAGRKYITVDLYRGDGQKFSIESGRSVHKDCNSHGNGSGYKLHLSEGDYLAEKGARFISSSVRDALTGLRNQSAIGRDLERDLFEVLKKHGLIDEQLFS